MYALRADAYLSVGDFDHAIADYTEAIRQGGSNRHSGRVSPGALKLESRGYAYLLKGDLQTAYHDFTEAIRLDPKTAYAYTLRGRVFQLAGQFDHAIADHDYAIHLYPEGIAYAERGRAHEATGDRERALADFDAALKLDPKVAEVHILDRGLIYERAGQRELARTEYEWALRMDSNLKPATQGLERIRAAGGER